jgi:hypothetical protein
MAKTQRVTALRKKSKLLDTAIEVLDLEISD